ncbi:CBS domain-containing protein [Streptomyces vietnamensis]|uniref:CBS domain-containing protein n=1 Tax=Streptomyces vietnamensis TaxID=362257 RepID=UPI0037B37E9F
MVTTRMVGEVMTGEVVQAHPDTSFEELTRLLTSHGISGLPVVDHDDKVIGMVSRTDLTRQRTARGRPEDAPDPILRRVKRTAQDRPASSRAPTAGELMTSPAVTVHPEQRVVEAARIMERRHIDRLPVVDEEDRLVGIATRRDLLRVFLRTDEEIRADVAEAVSVRVPAHGADQLRIHVRDGVVTLAGRPQPDADTSALIRAAWRVDGVVGVVNRPADGRGIDHARPGGVPLLPSAGSERRRDHRTP